jgi:hypothetical protein
MLREPAASDLASIAARSVTPGAASLRTGSLTGYLALFSPAAALETDAATVYPSRSPLP